MKIKVSDYLIKRLEKLGITEIFGLPGDYNFKIVESVLNNKNTNWIGSTNELNAGYAADGYARTKGYGAIITTFGVGELSAINAIAGSMAENVPVVKIVGVPKTSDIKNKTLLHHNLDNADYYAFYRAYKNVVKEAVFLDDKNKIKEKIDNILNTLIKYKKPVYIALPIDICDYETEDDEIDFIYPKSDEKNLSKVVDKIIKEIKKAKKPCIMADILTKRFEAKDYLDKLIKKTKIPSSSFLRGKNIIDENNDNYLGTYCGKHNLDCYKYFNTSDCIIFSGCIFSDLNTMIFDYQFEPNKNIILNPDFAIIRGEKFENVLIKDVINLLYEKIDFTYDKKITSSFGYKKPEIKKEEPLTLSYIYPRLQSFLKKDDIFITEVGLCPLGSMPMKLPKGTIIENQMLWGSIGWATPTTLGCLLADKSKRTVLITGDGSHQLTAQEIATIMRNDLKPIIFVINNSGYTVERVLCDDKDYIYNDISQWDYTMLPKVFKGDCFTKSVKTNKEFDETLNMIEDIQKDKMCYIELHTDYMDLPTIIKQGKYV